MGRAEWDNLAWWERRAYLEGLEKEELVRVEQAPANDLTSDGIGAAAALGFTEEVVGPDGVVRRVGPSGAFG